MVGPAFAGRQARQKIAAEAVGKRRDGAFPRGVRRFVEIAEDQPAGPPGPGEAAFDQAARGEGFAPAHWPCRRHVGVRRLEVTDVKRQLPDIRLKAVAAKDRTVRFVRRTLDVEVGRCHCRMARQAVDRQAAQKRDVQAAPVIARQAEAVRVGGDALGPHHLVVEMVERLAVEDLLQGQHIRVDPADELRSEAAVRSVERPGARTRIAGNVAVAGAV